MGDYEGDKKDLEQVFVGMGGLVEWSSPSLFAIDAASEQTGQEVVAYLRTLEAETAVKHEKGS